MSFSSSNSDSSLPQRGKARTLGLAQEIRRARSPLSTARNSTSRSKSRNRNRTSNDDYFNTFNPGSGSGFHSPPILEDDDEQGDILADQPALPSFTNLSNASTPREQSNRRRQIEMEMEDDARNVFQTEIQRDDEAAVVDQEDEGQEEGEFKSAPSSSTDLKQQHNQKLTDEQALVTPKTAAESQPKLNVLPASPVDKPNKAKPRVKFYNSSDDETTEEEGEDGRKDKKAKQASKERNSEEGSSATLGNSNSITSDGNKKEGEEQEESFKDRFKKKLNHVLGEDDDIPMVPGEETFLNRIINLGDLGGLVPGATKAQPQRTEDEEQRIGNNVPLQDMSPEQYEREANGLIKGHDFYQNKDSSATSSTFNFYANANDLSLRDELYDDYDINPLDGADGPNFEPGPARVQQGVLSSLMKLYQHPQMSQSSATFDSSDTESVLSGASSPYPGRNSVVDPKGLKAKLKNYTSHNRSASQSSVFNSDEETYLSRPHSKLSTIKSSASITGLLHPGHKSKHKASSAGLGDDDLANMPSFQSTKRPQKPKRKSKRMKAKRDAAKAKITVHIADLLQKQRFILRVCKALMLFGAPTHRLEEYLMMTARVLEIDGQFIYFPGVMLISFGDSATRTSDVKIVRCPQGLNLSKLHEVHKIYKAVVHDLMGVDEANAKLEELFQRKNLYPAWLCVIFYGLGSAFVTSWGFKGGWKDMPITFGIGICVGFLQFYVAPRSSLYSNVFEVTSSIVVSFLGRAIGTINSGKTFCFGSIVQSSLALILPGYIILCGSLELQSRNLVAGSVRMFYAIIYSLFLGFGITLGAALYGWIDDNATSNTTCSDNIQLSAYWRILFVPCFATILAVINQATLSQLPAMIVIAGLGYVVTYFAGLHFTNATEFNASMGAFVIGILGNLYSRVGRGMAASAMLPAIFVQVPSGVASQSSLLSGIETADNIVNNSTSSSSTSSMSFGITMVEVAIGISVGLFAAAIVVYPLGKKRTGLFTL